MRIFYGNFPHCVACLSIRAMGVMALLSAMALVVPQVQARSVHTLPSYATQAPANQNPAEPVAGIHPVDSKNAGINLWKIEDRHQVFSHTVLAPNRRNMAFTEALYIPGKAQVMARLYVAPLQAPPRLSDTHQLPEDYFVAQARQAMAERRIRQEDKKARTTCTFLVFCKTAPAPPPQPDASVTPANPMSRPILTVQAPLLQRQAFEMLVPVDWSQDGSTLLVKHTQGQLYHGITQSDVVTVDAATNRISRYPELHRAVFYYWQQQGIQPPLAEVNWLITPIGWEPGSSTKILNEAWIYTAEGRVFLGLWQLDIQSRAIQRLSLVHNPNVAVANNGALVSSQN